MPFRKNIRLFERILILFLFLIIGNARAQINESSLIRFYQNHQFNQIKQAIVSVSPKDSVSMAYLFFKTLFIKNGLQAKQNYERVFKQGDETLKKLAAQRLHDYYYAIGLYFKAAQYKNQLSDSITTVNGGNPPKAVRPAELFSEDSPFKIQFGAFSSKENAENQRQLLQRQSIQAKVVKRRINNHHFYCVWVNGLKNIEETRKFAEQIKKQVHLDYRIIKP